MHRNSYASVQILQRATLLFIAVLMGLATLLTISNLKASAATLTSRSLTIGTSQVSTSTSYNFAFTTTGAGVQIEGVRIQFCQAPLGACVVPAGFTAVSAAFVNQTGWSGGVNFADGGSADENDCTEATNSAREICFERTDTTSETAGARTINFNTITNANSETTVYARIQLYNDPDFETADLVHDGIVAAAMVEQLTVTGRVQERLQFCVAALADQDGADGSAAGTLPASVSTCTAISDTTVDLGVIDNTAISYAPVDNSTSLLGDDNVGIAMINTNANSGTVLTYFVEPDSGGTNETRAFRVDNATCQASQPDFTDQCFRSAANNGTTLAVASEYFGLYIPCVDTTQGAVATPMTVDADYNGFDDTTASVADCENADKTDNTGLNVVSWDDSGVATNLATSAGVLDDPIVKLSFAAAAAATTPTGTYTVLTTYIATPTF